VFVGEAGGRCSMMLHLPPEQRISHSSTQQNYRCMFGSPVLVSIINIYFEPIPYQVV
jgi:hypothetical protein